MRGEAAPSGGGPGRSCSAEVGTPGVVARVGVLLGRGQARRDPRTLRRDHLEADRREVGAGDLAGGARLDGGAAQVVGADDVGVALDDQYGAAARREAGDAEHDDVRRTRTADAATEG